MPKKKNGATTASAAAITASSAQLCGPPPTVLKGIQPRPGRGKVPGWSRVRACWAVIAGITAFAPTRAVENTEFLGSPPVAWASGRNLGALCHAQGKLVQKSRFTDGLCSASVTAVIFQPRAEGETPLPLHKIAQAQHYLEAGGSFIMRAC